MRWTKILMLVIGSAWFVPVSCSLGLYAGTHLNAELDARDVSQGDAVHSLFSVVVDSGSTEQPFQVIRMDDLQHDQELMDADSANAPSFLMRQPSGRKSTDTADYSYRVLEETSSTQIIEVVEAYHDGDNTIWSRYKASNSTITPISSRMFYFGYMFAAFPYAMALAFALYAGARYARSRVGASEPIPDDG